MLPGGMPAGKTGRIALKTHGPETMPNSSQHDVIILSQDRVESSFVIRCRAGSRPIAGAVSTIHNIVVKVVSLRKRRIERNS